MQFNSAAISISKTVTIIQRKEFDKQIQMNKLLKLVIQIPDCFAPGRVILKIEMSNLPQR